MKRLAAGLTLAALGVIPVLSATTAAHGRALTHDPRHTWGRSTSTNWSGYDVTGSNGTDAKATWTQPIASCSPGENSWSSPWVGIDGDNSGTVEQTGTDSDCQKGSPVYYAWYEMYPKSLVVIPFTPRPGDAITGEVRNTGGGGFLLTLTDKTLGASFSTTQSSGKAQASSVEWIMEGPSSGLLSDFGSVSFSAAAALISGQSGAIGSFAGAQSITMVTQQGVPRATPSSLGRGGGSFSVAWQHA